MAEGAQITILGICGSLRRASHNKPALHEAAKHAPQGVTVEMADISQIPPYDEDVHVKGFPAAVETFRRATAAADALLFATPKYNYSMPGLLKNAIDWASRPPNQPFAGKPVAILGATMGMLARRGPSITCVKSASSSTCIR